MVASPCVSACGMATGVIAWKPLSLLRNVSPWAWKECAGLWPIVKPNSRRTLGLCLEHQVNLVTLVPRTCAVRQELEAWGRAQPALPLLVEKSGRTQAEAPRR